MSLGWLREERDAHVLGALRVAFASLLLLLAVRFARELVQNGFFADAFYMPLLPRSWVPSRTEYVTLIAVQGLGSLLALVGVLARPALFTAALCGLYGFLCDRLNYHNNRYELLLLALLVAVTPCDRSFLWFGQTRPGTAPRWAARLVGAQISIVYLASSLGKLVDADWRTGAVLLPRFAVGRPVLEHFLPASLAALVSAPWFAHAASLAAIGSELFLALGLWFSSTRVLALWLGVMFHSGIELAAHVELFSYTMLSGYLAFVTPELRERRLSWNSERPLGDYLAALCRKLDLLARFTHEHVSEQASLLIVQDRAGLSHHGLAAWRELARALPPLFPLWLPLCLLTLRERRTQTYTGR